MERTHNIKLDNLVIFPTNRKDVLKRLRFTLESTCHSDKYLDPISHYAFKGACDELCRAISMIEGLSGISGILKNKKPNKILSIFYQLQDTYIK